MQYKYFLAESRYHSYLPKELSLKSQVNIWGSKYNFFHSGLSKVLQRDEQWRVHGSPTEPRAHSIDQGLFDTRKAKKQTRKAKKQTKAAGPEHAAAQQV